MNMEKYGEIWKKYGEIGNPKYEKIWRNMKIQREKEGKEGRYRYPRAMAWMGVFLFLQRYFRIGLSI